MKKNKIIKFFAMIMLFSMFFSVNVLAASEDGCVENDMIVTYTDRAGQMSNITFDAKCTYTVAWVEGYYGWVTDAVFSVSNTRLDGNSCTFTKKYNSSRKNYSRAYMDYVVNNCSMYIRVQILCDEWGEVSFESYEIEESELYSD